LLQQRYNSKIIIYHFCEKKKLVMRIQYIE